MSKSFSAMLERRCHRLLRVAGSGGDGLHQIGERARRLVLTGTLVNAIMQKYARAIVLDSVVDSCKHPTVPMGRGTAGRKSQPFCAEA